MARLTEQGGQKVVFRRIRGRLVPIKVNAKSSGGFKAAKTRRSNERKATRNIFKGAGLIGGGIGVSVASDMLSGFIMGRGTKKATGKILAARDIVNVAKVNAALKGKVSPGLLGRAANLTFGAGGASRKISRLVKGTSFLKAGGLLLGTSLTGAGVSKLADSFSGRDNGISGDVISHVVGTGVTILGARALRRGLKIGLGRGSAFKVNKKTQLEFKFDTGQQ